MEYKLKELTTDSCIHIFKRRDRASKVLHTHDFVEFIYILSGKAVQIINDCRFEVKHGDVIFINYKNEHAFETDDEFEYINVCLDAEFFSSLFKKDNFSPIISLTAVDELKKFQARAVSFQGEERKDCEALLFGMLKEYSAKKLFWEKSLVNYMNIYINMLLRKLSQRYIHDDIGDKWSEIIEYIESNLSEELTLSVIAQRCFYNPSYFSRIFKEKFNMSVSEFITRKRIERAKNLLETTDMTIEAISKAVGYTNRSALYRAFLRIEGFSIGDYRSK